VQLHAHTTESDGAANPQGVVDLYEGAGYSALAITDHEMITAQPSSTMVAIEGCEVTSNPMIHIVSTFCDYLRNGETDYQTILTGIKSAGGVSVIAHPTFPDEYPLSTLVSLTDYTGIEIYNALLGGYTSIWDQILSWGERTVWGFSSADLHINDGTNYNKGRIIVLAGTNTEAAIKAAILKGSFISDIGPSGITVGVPTVSESTISLTCTGATNIKFIGQNGVVLSTTDAATGSYTFKDTDRYVRAEATGADGTHKLYYQPISVNP
jgi:hypothetical protein